MWQDRQSGFNLLEVAMAGFIFSVISISFLGVWGMQVRGVEKSRHNLVASMLAEEIIEEAMASGYERTPLTAENEDLDDDGEPDPLRSEITMETEMRDAQGVWNTIPVLYRTEQVVNEIGTDTDKLKQVIVKVTWDDSTHTGEITLVTYLAAVF